MPASRDYPEGPRFPRPLVQIPGLLGREEGVLRAVDDEHRGGGDPPDDGRGALARGDLAGQADTGEGSRRSNAAGQAPDESGPPAAPPPPGMTASMGSTRAADLTTAAAPIEKPMATTGRVVSRRTSAVTAPTSRASASPSVHQPPEVP